MKRREFLLLLLASPLFANSEFEAYKNEFTTYKKDLRSEYLDFKRVYLEEFKAYKREILQVWREVKTTDVATYVKYSKDFKTRTVVDFKNMEMTIESQEKSPTIAANSIKKELKELLDLTTKEAYNQDFIAKVDKKLGVKETIEDNSKIVGDILEEKSSVEILSSATKEVIEDKKLAVKVTIKLPDNSLRKKAHSVSPLVAKYAQKEKIPSALVMAIIHSESHFNPMARSHIPAFGLMQIVPKSAGRDSMVYLTGKDTLLSSSFLYNKENNIRVGTAYLHILYYKYLKDIKDPQSKLYCVISAYNTGSGNVARAFVGTTDKKKAIKRINTMRSEDVYSHLINNLPYKETKGYLKKVNSRIELYS